MQKRKSQNSALSKVEKILKDEKINFSRDGNTITAKKEKMSGEGQKVEIKLTLEKSNNGPIIGSVRGLGRSLVSVPADMAITAYRARISSSR